MPGSQQPPQQQQQQQLNRDDLKAGWLDKRAGEGSNLASLPVSSVKWQRRSVRAYHPALGRAAWLRCWLALVIAPVLGLVFR